MKTKQVIVWTFIVVGLFGFLWLTGRSKASHKNEPIKILADSAAQNAAGGENQLIAPETLYDFGTISMKNGNVSKMFKVTNGTDKDVNFPSLTTSCMCTVAYFVRSDGNKNGPFGMPGMGFVPKLNETIKAGQSTDIEVVYDPNAHGPAGVGRIDRFVYLEDDNGNKLQFEIKANVTP